ncbi:MAG TPA: MBL fold metallo-hydrolase [Thermodesulfovibrionia bacterium]|nr:MBL fold metallo-hydrolase [Thermodesulfovibrionia bacterium]
MVTKIWTWGSGAAFGRELGTSCKNRSRRSHIATSIINDINEKEGVHFLIDSGAPCVEEMIDKDVKSPPDVLFITHSHKDHISDLDKLANSRKRGIIFSKNKAKKKDEEKNFSVSPLPVICTNDCLNHPIFGLKKDFDYLKSLNWIIIPSYDVWYSIRKRDYRLIPTSMITDDTKCLDSKLVFPIEFKALPVYHAVQATGSCLYIFRIRSSGKDFGKRIVISGDFESIEDNILKNEDLKNPAFILLETNTINATGTNHTNWIQNMKLLKQWITGESYAYVLLNHLAGYEDWEQGCLDNIPDDKEWKETIFNFKLKNATIEIATDGQDYTLK